MSRSAKSGTSPVLAAGAVLWRMRRKRLEVVLVHRPKYNDWSLPKGKLDEGEHLVTTARREVYEETGLRPRLSRRLPSQVYPVTVKGTVRTKVVRWWVARPETERPKRKPSTSEVDDVRWLTVDRAMQRLTHDRDRVLLRSLDLAPLDTTTVLLARHASAGSRSDWPGPDRERPLDPTGRAQSVWLREYARAFGPTGFCAADLVRCVDTLGPSAKALNGRVRRDDTLSEHCHDRDPDAAVQTLVKIAKKPGPTFVCSQGGVIPDVVETLHARADLPLPPRTCPKGSLWVLSFQAGNLVASDFHADLDPDLVSLPDGALGIASAGGTS